MFRRKGGRMGNGMRGIRAIAVALLLASGAAPGFAGGAEDQVLSLINKARAAKGCGALVMNDKLSAAARGHASAMAKQNFFSHTGKDGSRFSGRIKAQGYSYQTAAENIGAGYKSPEAAVKGWMASSGHRRNILNCRMTETGIAMVYQADDQPIKGNPYALHYYWVQVFAKP